MITQRFNPPKEWYMDGWNNCNKYFLGLTHLINHVWNTWNERGQQNWNMIEIGAYMGESTMMFASTGMFNTINVIEPFKGEEEFNDMFMYDWDVIESEFNTNTRFFDNINLYKDYSYNIVDKFEDKSIDFIYIDAEHTLDSLKRDLELYLPKLKPNGIIAGHDYNKWVWPDVVKLIDDMFGDSVQEYIDTSWMVKL